jgi:hypothetical protein
VTSVTSSWSWPVRMIFAPSLKAASVPLPAWAGPADGAAAGASWPPTIGAPAPPPAAGAGLAAAPEAQATATTAVITSRSSTER